MKHKLAFLVLLAVQLALGWSPAARAESPTAESPSPPRDMALVYVYRVGTGEEVKVGSVHISVDGKAVFGVKNYGYSWFYISAGPHEFKAEWSFMEKPRMEDGHFGPSVVTLETEPGKTYYINYLVNQLKASKGVTGFWASSGLIGKASSKSHVISDGLVIEDEALGAPNVRKCRFQANQLPAQ